MENGFPPVTGLERVSAQLKLSKAAPQTTLNNQELATNSNLQKLVCQRVKARPPLLARLPYSC
jgi:hypothetical protein